MDKDSSKNKYSPDSYYNMKNFRVTSFDELCNGNVISIKGNTLLLSAPTYGGSAYIYDFVIGWKIIRNYLVVWTTDCNTADPGGADAASRGTIHRTDLSVAVPSWTLVYTNNAMNLTAQHPIYDEVVGYYESDTLIKVYWTDNFNQIRFIDIIAPDITDVSELDILGETDFVQPTIRNILSGYIYAGMIQYAFQYYNINGVETCFSPCTPLIHLTQSGEGLTGAYIRLYKGTPALDDSGNPSNSGKSVTIEIDGADTDYDRIRIVAVLYRNLNQEPDIHVVGEYDVIDNLVITDYGSYTMGTITWNAFRTLGNPHLFCKTMTQKGNKMLIGNITEKFFDIDFDARAYRFKATVDGADWVYDCKVGTASTGVYQTIVKTGVWPAATYLIAAAEVPAIHDCVCPYNYDFATSLLPEVATYDDTDAFAYKYQENGIADPATATIGGEGPNVKYEFLYESMVFEESANSRYTQPDIVVIEDLSSYDSYKNPLRCAYMLNFKHDEIYRMGLVGVNSKGQDSFVKWIGDIRFPTVIESPLCALSVGTTSVAHPLGIKFTINTASLLTQDVVAIKIVRVERKESDRTILTQGIASNMFLVSAGTSSYRDLITGYTRSILKRPTEGMNAGYLDQDDVIQFISPEINYFKNISPSTNDYIKVVSRLTERTTYLQQLTDTLEDWGTNERTAVIGGSDFPTLFDGNSWINVSKYLTTNITGVTTLPIYNILDGILAGPVEWGGEDDNKISLPSTPGGFYILNRSLDFTALTMDTTNHEGISGTCFVLVLDANIDQADLISTDELELLLFDYKRPGIAAAQYGGLTYSARQNNTYIDCGIYTSITGGEDDIEIYGGDTFIDFHEHLRTMWSVDDNNGDTNPDVTDAQRFMAITSFPCESVINLGLSHGYKFSANYTDYYVHAIREESGNHNGAFGALLGLMPTNDYDLFQDINMYEYNSVYSQQNISKLYFMEPTDYEFTIHDDTLTKISLEKVPREETDSFLQFLTDNEKMLPTGFGPINDMFEFKNFVLVFMDHAIGTLSVDERAVLPIQNNSLLELGSADNLRYFDFISTDSGTIHPMSVEKIGNGFCWFDANQGMFGLYNGETQDLGLIKGLSSKFKGYADYLKDYVNQFHGGTIMIYENKRYKEVICALVVSELATYNTQDVSYVEFCVNYSPAIATRTKVIINGVEWYASTDAVGAGILTINKTDNPTLNPKLYGDIPYFIYYKDYSYTFSYSSIIGAYMFEIDIWPTWLIDGLDNLYDIYGRFVLYKENEGNHGEFYGTYREGEMEYLINPQGSITCIFNNYEYGMEAITSAGINTIDETWDSIIMKNDYQYSVSDGIACIMVNAGDTISTLAHGLEMGDRVMFSGSSIPAEIDTEVLYYALIIDANTFQISTTYEGAAVVFNSNGVGYYHTLEIPLTVDDNVKRRMRTWRIKDLRDRGILANTPNLKPRMRDSYIRILLKYLHGSNKKIVMHDLYTYYTVTRESLYK